MLKFKSKIIESTDIDQFEARLDTVLKNADKIIDIQYSVCVDPVSDRRVHRSALIVYIVYEEYV